MLNKSPTSIEGTCLGPEGCPLGRGSTLAQPRLVSFVVVYKKEEKPKRDKKEIKELQPLHSKYRFIYIHFG